MILTGAGGFAGHHCLEHILVNTDWNITATDSFRHKGKTDRIAEVLDGHPDWQARVTVITHDLAAPFTAQTIQRLGPVDYMLAYASESHVDRSITDPVPFIRNNVDVALSTLELARQVQPRAVFWISTDEVYGPEPVVDGAPVPHAEWAPVLPSNPYASSKAAQEAIAIGYWRTYGLPVTIVNCMNILAQRQHVEKYLPTLISRISRGREVGIHGRPSDIGSRHYLHARNLADGILFLLREAPVGVFPAHLAALEGKIACRPADRPNRYNIVGPDRIDNLTLAQMVAGIIGEPLKYRLIDFHSARPGHDPHYGLDGSKMAALGWKPPVPFEESLAHTVKWTLAHPAWLLEDEQPGLGGTTGG